MTLTYSQKNKLFSFMRLTLEIILWLSVLIACVPTKLYYKCQMFLWWRLFSSFADSLKVLGGGIHFKLIESFLVVERRWCRCLFSLLKLINRRFSRESHYKNFSVHLFSKSKLPLWFCHSRRHSPPQVMRSFSDFFICSPVTFVI